MPSSNANDKYHLSTPGLAFSCVSKNDQCDVESENQSDVPSDDPVRHLHIPRRVVIIISGYRYETLDCTLAAFPDTLLGNPSRRRDYFDPSSGALRFFRDPVSFDAILFYYQSKGILARPKDIQRDVFQKEVEFFGISATFDKRHQFEQNLLCEKQTVPKMPENYAKRFLWSIFEYPHSSLFASVVGIFSTVMIMVSVASLCVETLPALKRAKTVSFLNVTKGNSTEQEKLVTYGYDHWHAVETFCIAWFTFEYIIRVLSAPSIIGFAFSALGLVDLISIIPFYVTLIIRQEKAGKKIMNTFGIMRMLRLVRIIRVFKLTRYNEGLRILVTTIYESAIHLRSILLVIFIMAVFFATIVFYVESFFTETSEEVFKSVPDTFWYSIITMTTVGYGDVYPQTLFGKLCGALCGIFGVLLFCLPSPVLVNKFIECYYLRQNLPENESKERKAFVESMKEIYFKGT